MRRAFFQALLIALLLLGPFGALWWRQVARVEGLHSHEVSKAPDQRIEPSKEGVVERETGSLGGEEMPPVIALEPEWEAAFLQRPSVRDPRAGLRAVGQLLKSLDSAEAVSRIVAYLESGRDLESGLPWALGAEGRLVSAPTLRVWLLDWLGRLDPSAGAQYAMSVLALGPAGSADEWALLMRNLAWGQPEAVDLLTHAALQMLAYPSWRSNPSAGFQEGFDVFVWAGATEVTPVLAALLPRFQPQSLRVPAQLALDRLILQHSEPVLELLYANFSVLDPQPYTRAGYFARADLGSTEEQRLVELYFLDSRVGAAERDYFLGMIPNLNLTFSYNLLSSNSRPTREEVLEQLHHAEVLLSQWVQDSRFRAWAVEIDDALSRLHESY